MPVEAVGRLIENRVEALRDYHRASGLPRAQVDVSGGVDSAVVLALSTRALGPDLVTAVYSGIHSSAGSLERAREVADGCGARLVAVDLTAHFDGLLRHLEAALEAAGYDLGEIRRRAQADPTVHGSIRSTLRAPVGRACNRLTGGGIRHGTGNECEDRWLRFYQKGGDGEVDTNPIGMLSKGEVYQLAIGLGVPRSVLQTVPSPDLWAVGDTHTDEDELFALTGVPFTYSRVDPNSGRYMRVGSIERTSRFVDWALGLGLPDPFGDTLTHEEVRWLVRQTARFPGFRGLEAPPEQVLVAARTAERASRHKANPNLPTLGDREALRAAGIVTDELPELSSADCRAAGRSTPRAPRRGGPRAGN